MNVWFYAILNLILRFPLTSYFFVIELVISRR